LILLDLSMPLMSGLEVLKWRLTQTGIRSIPVIVFTSSRHRRDVEDAFQLGANAYLVKPSSAEGLVELAEALKLFWLTHSELPRISTAGGP
jgi:CheY-like chemotaxis protein